MTKLFMRVGCSVIAGLNSFPSLIVLVCLFLEGVPVGKRKKACSWNIGEGLLCSMTATLSFPCRFLSLSLIFYSLVVAGVPTSDLTRTDTSTKSCMYSAGPDHW